jgi:predicted alpha/beta hydrolase family esterase
MRFLVLPGFGDSGPRHWQTLWEKRDPRFKRVKQRDWDHPDRAEWVGALGRTIADYPGDMVLVAHSLACLLVAHWTQASQPRMRGRVRAAFLVAPVDPGGPAFPPAATGFAPVPVFPLPFPSLVVASTNDPYAKVAYAAGLAQAWGSRCEIVGPKGHLNADSDLGEWPEGQGLLESLLLQAGLAPERPSPGGAGTPIR